MKLARCRPRHCQWTQLLAVQLGTPTAAAVVTRRQRRHSQWRQLGARRMQERMAAAVAGWPWMLSSLPRKS